MATPAHPSYGHLSQEEWEAAKNAPFFGGASEFKKKASRRRCAAKAAATRAAKAAATRAAKAAATRAAKKGRA